MRRISPLERLRLFGRAGIDVVATLGRSMLFLVGALFGRNRAGKPMQLLIKQLFAVGVMSLAIIVVSLATQRSHPVPAHIVEELEETAKIGPIPARMLTGQNAALSSQVPKDA